VTSDYLVEITFARRSWNISLEIVLALFAMRAISRVSLRTLLMWGWGMRVPPLNVVLSDEMVRDEIFVTQIAHVVGAQGCAMPSVDAPSALPNHPHLLLRDHHHEI
jgi:hypothetical protein